jgi:phosphatidylglycerophosphatase A
MNESMQELYEKSVDILEERGVTIKDIAELVKSLQEPYNPDITLEICYKNVESVLKKREVAHAVLTGIALMNWQKKNSFLNLCRVLSIEMKVFMESMR